MGIASSLNAGVGGIIQALGTNEAATDAARKYREQAAQYGQTAGQGRDVLSANQQAAQTAYQPYSQLGAQAAEAYSQALASGQPAFGYKQGEFNYDQFKDPGTQFRMDQANKAIQASAIAKGGMGGGLAKALQTNSQSMASQEYGNAFNRFMDTSKMNYGQASDQYQRGQAWTDRLGNAAAQGQQGAANMAGLNQGYANALNSSWLNQAGAQADLNSQGIGARLAGQTAMYKGLNTAGQQFGQSADEGWEEYKSLYGGFGG